MKVTYIEEYDLTDEEVTLLLHVENVKKDHYNDIWRSRLYQTFKFIEHASLPQHLFKLTEKGMQIVNNIQMQQYFSGICSERINQEFVSPYSSEILQKHLTKLYHGFNITMLGNHEERLREFITGLKKDLENSDAANELRKQNKQLLTEISNLRLQVSVYKDKEGFVNERKW